MLEEYQNVVRGAKVYPDMYRVIYPALGLGGESGEVLEKVKKLIRDDNGELTPERSRKILLELGDVVWYVTALADDIDSTLEEVIEMNTDKILSRQRRNTIKGEGDDR